MRCRRLLAGGALVAVLAVSGCSGGSGPKVATLGANDPSSSSSSGSGDAKQSFQDAMVSYTKCMREHGIDMPDPTFSSTDGGGGGGFAVVGGPPPDGSSGGSTNAAGPSGATFDPNREDFKAADSACKPILDAATKDLPKPSPEELAKQRDEALAFAKCMREHGIDMPDPTFDDSGAISIRVGGDSNATGDSKSVAGPDQAFQDAAKACQSDGKGGAFVTNAEPAVKS